MTTAQIIVFAILAATFGLFLWGRWRHDVVAMLALLSAVVLGVVPGGQAFAGFGHPATVTVAVVLILSRALALSGATDAITENLAYAAHRVSLHIAALSCLGAVLSAFMNNVGTLGLLMPAALRSAAKEKRSPSILLMPLSFATILGGLVTLIGTPPNIIISTFRDGAAGEPFAMFDFAFVGLPTALIGVAFVALIGWRLIPKQVRGQNSPEELFDIENYLAELAIPEGSALDGEKYGALKAAAADTDVVVVSILRRGERMARAVWQELKARDVLVVEGGPENIDKFVTILSLEVAGAVDGAGKLGGDHFELAEVVVPSGSRVENRTVQSLNLRRRWGVSLLGVSRHGKPYRGRLRALEVTAGDILLLHGEADHLPDVITELGLLPLAGRGLTFGAGGKAGLAVGIFAAAIAVAALGWLPIAIAFGVAVAAMVLFNVLPARRLYQAVDWPVIVLLGAMIPLGGALETSGGTALITTSILALAENTSPIFILGLVLVVTMTLSDILNNAATAVIMAPIGISIAGQLNASSDPFLMAVAVGASCAFLTPIGHQNNTLVMGPGGYGFGDYWRMGLPLEIIIVVVSLPLIVTFWPLF